MAISKIILNGVTQMDLTGDTVVADKLLQSYTAHGADGEPITGTSTAIVPTGTKSITANGTGIDVAQYASVDVAVGSIRKVTGTVTGNGNRTISLSLDSEPDIFIFYRSDIENMTAVSDRAHCISLGYRGRGVGSAYTSANSTNLTNSGFVAFPNSTVTVNPPQVNRYLYTNGIFYLSSGNNANLWSTSLTYNYELYYFS